MVVPVASGGKSDSASPENQLRQGRLIDDVVEMQIRVGPSDNSAVGVVLHGETREWPVQLSHEEELLHDTAAL